jgi:hypothetical protein
MDFVEMDTTVRALLFGGLFLVSLAVVLWVVYDSQARLAEGGPSWFAAYWVVAVVGAILVLPALVINAFNLEVEQQDLVNPLSYLGIAGAATAVVCSAGYALHSRLALREGAMSTIPAPAYEPGLPEPTVQSPDVEAFLPEKTVLLERPPKRFAYFIVTSGLRAGTPFHLSDVTSIGRDGRDNDIVLDDEGVSSHHARVRFDSGKDKFVFRDLDSTNGSYLITSNSKERIEAPHVLSDGDILQIGSTTLVFKQLEEPPQGQ